MRKYLVSQLKAMMKAPKGISEHKRRAREGKVFKHDKQYESKKASETRGD